MLALRHCWVCVDVSIFYDEILHAVSQKCSFQEISEILELPSMK